MPGITIKSKDRKWRRGQPIGEYLDADILNSLEERINRLERTTFLAPLKKNETPQRIVVSCPPIPRMEWVQLLDEVDPYEDGDAVILHMNTTPGEGVGAKDDHDRAFFVVADADGDTGNSSSSGDISYPEKIKVVDIFGISSQPKCRGQAWLFQRANVKRWVFIPQPVCGGEATPDYDSTKWQALVHDGQGLCKWMDIDDCECPESGSSSSSGS